MSPINSAHIDIADILPPARVVTFKKGSIILRPDDTGTHIHSVRSGLVKAYTINARGEENTLVIYGPGELFPLGWIIELRTQDLYFQALSDCEVAMFERNEFMSQLRGSTEISFLVIQKILEQFYLYSAMVNNMSFKYARERIAYRLLLLAAGLGEKAGEELNFPHITQQDLASTVNVSRENVSREITRFEKMGALTYRQPRIVIHDPALLKKELGDGVKVMFFDQD